MLSARFILIFIYSFVISSESNDQKQQQPRPPNVVFIVADDLGWDDVSFHGSSQIRTPNIDMLAKSGVILNNYYVQPLCTPSRSAIMTGRYPIHTGMQHDVIYTGCRWGLSPDLKIMPQWLKSMGYSTHGIGKWHLGFHTKQYIPTRRGFDTFYGYYNGNSDYWDHSSQGKGAWGLDLHDNEKSVFDQWGNYSSNMFTDIAIDRIKQHDKKNPLFLYLAYQAVHSANRHDPIQAPAVWINKFKHIKNEQRRRFAAVAAVMDHGIGRVYNELKDAGMMDNTVIIFTSDNGGAVNGFNSNYGSNHPLRGEKSTLWEGGVRANAFVHSNLLKSSNGRVSNGLFHITDWLPTLYSLAGGDTSSIPGLDGTNIWDAISMDTPSPRNEILLNYDPVWSNSFALRVGDYKVISSVGGPKSNWFTPPEITEDTYTKTVSDHDSIVVKCGGRVPTNVTNCSQNEGGPCLFNIKVDPCEYHNLAEEMPEVLQKMLSKVEKYRETMIKPRNNYTIDPLSNPKLHGGVWEPWV